MIVDSFKCNFVPQEEIWKIVEEFRKQHWPTGILPVDIEQIIEVELKMNIIPEHYIRQYAKIDAFIRSDFSGIIVDHEQYMDPMGRYEKRLRFSFAHEIGHYVLHRSIYEELHFESPREYADFVLNMPESEHRKFEWQANEFAGRLLVPKNHLQEEILKIYIKLKENSLLQILAKEPEQVLESVAPTLAKPFLVSEDVIVKRVERECLWPPKSG